AFLVRCAQVAIALLNEAETRYGWLGAGFTGKIAIRVVLVGAQRPASALSGDGPMNIVNAIRVAADPGARGLGALVLLNDDIQAARDVTKTSSLRMQTFRTADFGALGHADGDMISWYRKPIRKIAPDTEFDVRGLEALPRVDIA
ncbi:MAG: asparaginase domain-containing protein, partial [Alphaproteobacteria bacterium]